VHANAEPSHTAPGRADTPRSSAASSSSKAASQSNPFAELSRLAAGGGGSKTDSAKKSDLLPAKSVRVLSLNLMWETMVASDEQTAGFKDDIQKIAKKQTKLQRMVEISAERKLRKSKKKKQ
jgi:hypothetical protein